MTKDKYYKITEDLLKNYKNLKDDDLDKKKIDIVVRSLTDRELILFGFLYCSNKKLRYIEIADRMNISKSTYYELKRSLIKRASYIMYPECIKDLCC